MRGGKRVRVCFDSVENGLIVPVVKEIAYPHSKWAKKHCGCGEWVVWEGTPKRPAQAFKELFFLFRDLGWIDNAEGARVAVEYFAGGGREKSKVVLKKLL